MNSTRVSLQISLITTKRAYEELERDGYIETVAGKGSFVAAQNKELLKEKRLRIVRYPEDPKDDTWLEVIVDTSEFSALLKRLIV